MRVRNGLVFRTNGCNELACHSTRSPCLGIGANVYYRWRAIRFRFVSLPTCRLPNEASSGGRAADEVLRSPCAPAGDWCDAINLAAPCAIGKLLASKFKDQFMAGRS